MAFDGPSDSDNDVPDWLKGLQPEEEAADFEPESADVPSWMDEDEGSEDASASQEGEVPEWLANIRKQERPAEEMPEAKEDTGALSPEDKKDTADWLEKIRVQYARDTGQLEMPEEEEEDSDVGDYMDRVQALKAQDVVAESKDEEEEWLEGLIVKETEEPTPDDSGWDVPLEGAEKFDLPEDDWGAEASPESDEEGPDWLSGLPSIDTDMLPEEEVQPFTPGDDVPEWLAGMEPESGGPAGIPSFTAPDEEKPDWLANLATGRIGETTAEADVEGEAEIGDLDQELSEVPTEPTQGTLPNWLENLKFSPDESKPGVREEAAIIEDYSDEDVSSLLFEADDLPDWLSEEAVQPAEEALPPAAAIPPAPFDGDEDIAPAELPSWLQAMRPIEAEIEQVQEDEEELEDMGDRERVGPLAGLADVLPAEPHIVHFGTRVVPVTGFELSQAQKHYTGLLTSMLSEEAEAPPVTRRKVAIPQQMLRWIIAILIMLVAFFGSLAGGENFNLPQSSMPAEQIAVFNQIAALSEESKVLVAFDYQPGYSGEMEAASHAVMDHLLQRGVKISLVSTQIIGPDTAERFLKTHLSSYPYVSDGLYVNLGYISGGAAGLRNFAEGPSSAISLFDENGFNLWNQPPLNNIRSITDYALVLVITDDPDLARTWVEQVQPLLDPQKNGTGTALMMVVSAQAAPLVYPFYLNNPRQVSGLVSGVVGGAYYENVVTGIDLKEGTAQNYWFAYNISTLIAVVLIGGISMINLFGVLVRRLGKSTRRGSA